MSPVLDSFQHTIGGELVDSADGKTFPTVDPAEGIVYATAAEGGREDARAAITAARTAFDRGPWPRMDPEERRTPAVRARRPDRGARRRAGAARVARHRAALSATRHHDIPRAR